MQGKKTLHILTFQRAKPNALTGVCNIIRVSEFAPKILHSKVHFKALCKVKSLGTGLRLRDIEIWRVSDIDFENSYVTTRSKKTRKSMGSRPVPVPIMAELKKYVSGLDAKQENIFTDNFSR